MNKVIPPICALVITTITDSSAQVTPSNATDIELYESAVPMDRPELTYPDWAIRRLQEGWVKMNFMVNPDGEAYEVMVVENVGDARFVDVALEHIEQVEYRPARIGDRTVHGSLEVTYRFSIDGAGDGARRRFAFRHREFVSALNEGSQEEANDALRNLEQADVTNNYEYAYLSVARFQYAQRYGNTAEQMHYLDEALGESIDKSRT